jgi:hypothetical protein
MSDEAADHPRLCADQTVPAPVTVASTATDVDTCRVPRAGHAGQRALCLAWLSADPYIPVARDDRDGTVHNVWAGAGKRCELAMKLVDAGRLNPGRSDERLRPRQAPSWHLLFT